MQEESVDLVSLQRLLLRWLENDARDVQMLGVRERLIDPCLDDASVEHVAGVSHGHDLFDASLEGNSVGLLIRPDAAHTIVESTCRFGCTYGCRDAFTTVIDVWA